jgi:hypothetical protein
MQVSTSSSTSDVDFHEWRRAMLRIRTTCVRSALAGLTLRGGLHALSSIIFLISKLRRSTRARKRALSWMDALIDTARWSRLFLSFSDTERASASTWLLMYNYLLFPAVLSTLKRFTALLGSMGGLYVLLDEGLSILLGKDRWEGLMKQGCMKARCQLMYIRSRNFTRCISNSWN